MRRDGKRPLNFSTNSQSKYFPLNAVKWREIIYVLPLNGFFFALLFADKGVGSAAISWATYIC